MAPSGREPGGALSFAAGFPGGRSGTRTRCRPSAPTWALLVFLQLNGDLAVVPLALGGAVAAASGRLLLAAGSRWIRGRL
jgi:hypothetical protein